MDVIPPPQSTLPEAPGMAVGAGVSVGVVTSVSVGVGVGYRA